MRSRIFAVLAIAVLAGGGLAYGTYNMISNPAGEDGRHADAARRGRDRDLALGTELKADDLKVVNFPQGQAPEGAFQRAGRHRRPRPDHPDGQERAGAARQARLEGSGRPACRR